MNSLTIAVEDERTSFQPGDELAGVTSWTLEEAPRALELRLFWFTRGKGDRDAEVVDTVRFDNPKSEESRPFRFRLPAAPYSFSGKLISLVWALELVAEPGKQVERVEITISPTGQEILLHKGDQADRSGRGPSHEGAR